MLLHQPADCLQIVHRQGQVGQAALIHRVWDRVLVVDEMEELDRKAAFLDEAHVERTVDLNRRGQQRADTLRHRNLLEAQGADIEIDRWPHPSTSFSSKTRRPMRT